MLLRRGLTTAVSLAFRQAPQILFWKYHPMIESEYIVIIILLVILLVLAEDDRPFDPTTSRTEEAQGPTTDNTEQEETNLLCFIA